MTIRPKVAGHGTVIAVHPSVNLAQMQVGGAAHAGGDGLRGLRRTGTAASVPASLDDSPRSGQHKGLFVARHAGYRHCGIRLCNSRPAFPNRARVVRRPIVG
jgi:hypothetical protein